MSVAAVVVAAGQGVRFGGPKQFFDLDGRTVAAHSVERARAVADFVVLVVPADYDGDGEGADHVVEGGATRSDSVRAGLQACADAEIVIVHDAARPRASVSLFTAVVDAVRAGADGAIPALPLSDTVKEIRHDGDLDVVVATLDREVLVSVQTPQAFRHDVLARAHATGAEATDDAALVEALGGRIVTVVGERTNVKLTHPDDLEGMRGAT